MKFSVFRHDEPEAAPPGKHFTLQGGELKSTTVGRLLSSRVNICELNEMQELRDLVEGLDSRHHFTAGTPHHTESHCLPGADVAAFLKRDISVHPDSGLPLVARNNASMPHREGLGLLCIDGDAVDDLQGELFEVSPFLGDHEHIYTTSSSSRIFQGETELRGVRGAHLYYQVADATDIPRALEVLHRRQVLAGKGRHKLNAIGAFLERSAVDLALRIPSQPIFLRATLGEGLEQRKITTLSGGQSVLDTRALIPDLTAAELEEFAGMLADAREALAPEGEALREQYIENRIQEMVARGVSENTARATVAASIVSGDLYADHQVYVGGRSVTVREILAEPEKYHGKPCRDPVEPGYGGNSSAKIFANQRTPLIHSLAHGLSLKYHLHGEDNAAPDITVAEVFAKLQAKDAAETKAIRGNVEMRSWVDFATITGKKTATCAAASIDANTLAATALRQRIGIEGQSLEELTSCPVCPEADRLGAVVFDDEKPVRALMDVVTAGAVLQEWADHDLADCLASWEKVLPLYIEVDSPGHAAFEHLAAAIKKVTKRPIAELREDLGFILSESRAAVRDCLAEAMPALPSPPEPELDPEEREALELQRKQAKAGALLQQCRHIAADPWGHLERTLAELGVVGERRTTRFTYLVATSTHLLKPISAAVKGQSSSGKSYSVKTTLRLFPEEVVYFVTSMSNLSIMYEAEGFEHRLIFLAEGEALVRHQGDEKNAVAELLRNLVSEGLLRHKVTERDAVTGEHVTRTVEKKGPTSLITTTVRPMLDPEMETRMISIWADESNEQTRKILGSIAGAALDGEEQEFDLSDWHAFAEWVRQGPRRVAVPFASLIAEDMPDKSVRSRRDVSSVLAVIKATALVNRYNREVSENGAIVATLEDYEVARDIVNASIAETSQSGINDEARLFIEQFESLVLQERWEVNPKTRLPEKPGHVEESLFGGTEKHQKWKLAGSQRALAKLFDMSPATFNRRVNYCINRDLLRRGADDEKSFYWLTDDYLEVLDESTAALPEVDVLRAKLFPPLKEVSQ